MRQGHRQWKADAGAERSDLRAARREITMIFQQFNLLMQRTCLRNIMFPMELAKVPRDKAEARARELLELVGLPDKADATRPSFPAVKSSASPSPARWRPTRRCCSAMRQPAHWTPTRPMLSCS